MIRGTQIPGASSPEPPNFVRWYLMFVGPQDGSCFMLPFWCPKILSFLVDFRKICATLLMGDNNCDGGGGGGSSSSGGGGNNVKIMKLSC